MKLTHDAELERYSRQVLFEPIGADGQLRLQQSRVALVGCGALGTVVANTLVRGGIGFLRICDRDFIEPNNLQRQVLFDERDIEENLPKSIAAARKLERINSRVEVEPLVTDVNHANIERLCDKVDLILDGTDNFETRYLINDFSVKSKTPWIYAAVIGASGLVMAVLPGETPCLRCVFESAPPPEMSPTCDTAGVIGPAVNVVASLEAVEAIKLLAGKTDELNRALISIDVWTGRISHLNVDKAKNDAGCVCCDKGDFEYLRGDATSTTTTLCGRDAVQVSLPGDGSRKVDFASIAAKIGPVATGPISRSKFMLKATLDRHEVTVFADGRAIIKGTKSPDEAKTIYSKFIGN